MERIKNPPKNKIRYNLLGLAAPAGFRYLKAKEIIQEEDLYYDCIEDVIHSISHYYYGKLADSWIRSGCGFVRKL